MTSAAQPTTRRRWFRFSLRTLLIVVALAAVCSWGYWIAWPWFRVYLEEQRFKIAAMQLKVGMKQWDAEAILHRHGYAISEIVDADDEQGNRIGISRVNLSSSIYFIFFRCPREAFPPVNDVGPCTSVEVFRMPPMPSDYRARTVPGHAEYNARSAFNRDFLEIIAGDRKNNHGFQFRLIYSDPPQNDKPK